MTTPRIYVSGALAIDQNVALDNRTSHYLARVLRCQLGDSIEIFNGDGRSYSAHIIALDKRQVQLQITQRSATLSSPSPLDIHIGIAISKGDRMDTIVQKCTELGVTQITPLLSEHVAFKLKAQQQQRKHQHWQQIIISACEQSQQNTLATLHAIDDLAHWIEVQQSSLKLCLAPNQEQSIKDFADRAIKSIALLIGPEGGLSENEIKRAAAAGFEIVGLGPRVLRTETAPIVAATIAQYLWGDL